MVYFTRFTWLKTHCLPVCKLKYKKTYSPKLLQPTESRWHWRRSFRRHVFFISNGRLLTSEKWVLRWDLVCLLSLCQQPSITQIICGDPIDHVKLCCVSVLRTHARAPFWSYIHPLVLTIAGKARSYHPGPCQYCQPLGWKAVSLSIKLPGLERTELLLMCKTLHYTNKCQVHQNGPEWMCIFSETLLQYSLDHALLI